MKVFLRTIFFTLILIFFTTVTYTDDIPPNAHLNIYGNGWECDKGYYRFGNECKKVIIPPNAHLNYFGSGWECDKGYYRFGNECKKVIIPPNAHLNYFGNGWECDKGYYRFGNECKKVIIPPNAHLNYFGSGWECDKGYYRFGNECKKVIIPLNAHLNYYGNGWECDKGYKRSGNECRPMTPAELNQQKELERAILKQRQERRFQGISGDDCEWEYESEAEVCVTVTNVSLDCDKSYDGSYYRSCEVVVDYEVLTDYEGDGYLEVEVECTVDIQYKRRDYYSWSSDSDNGDENHSLYSNDSDSGDMSFDFSFSSYEEVTSVKIDSVECEINDVSQY